MDVLQIMLSVVVAFGIIGVTSVYLFDKKMLNK